MNINEPNEKELELNNAIESMIQNETIVDEEKI
jgi:hypothetical protein